ncbi:hypothetical protein LINPERHAP2_LOCUS28780 [Linum perenne]
MSGGTPTRGCVRQRHSQGGYGSSSDDLEDDACSRPRQNYFIPTPPRPRSWMVIVENMVWIASAIFVVYYGDRHSNFVYLLWHDGRVRSYEAHYTVEIIFSRKFIAWNVSLKCLCTLEWRVLVSMFSSFCTQVCLLGVFGDSTRNGNCQVYLLYHGLLCWAFSPSACSVSLCGQYGAS